MKSILISIKPEWVAKILGRDKTIEIRKTAPKCKLPIDVYIYCTKGAYIGYLSKIYVGKVVAKFTLKEIEECVNPYFSKGTFATKTMTYEGLLSNSQLTETEFSEYINKGARGYAWHISDLEIFDEPKKLNDFGLKRAPQSWCYVEELK